MKLKALRSIGFLTGLTLASYFYLKLSGGVHESLDSVLAYATHEILTFGPFGFVTLPNIVFILGYSLLPWMVERYSNVSANTFGISLVIAVIYSMLFFGAITAITQDYPLGLLGFIASLFAVFTLIASVPLACRDRLIAAWENHVGWQ